MDNESKPVFRLVKRPNGFIRIEYDDEDGNFSLKMDQDLCALLASHIERGLATNFYVGVMMLPKACGISMLDALDFTSDSSGVVCVTIGSACSGKKASLFITASSWIQSSSFQN